MAGAVTPFLRRLLGAAVLLAWGAPAAALDPTQPPAVLRALPAAATASTVPPAAVPERLRLQGLRLGPAPSALINGQVLSPGQRWQGHTLLRLETDAAVLRDPEGRLLRLLLLPSSPSAAAPAPRGNRP